MKQKIKEVLNLVLNSRIFVALLGIMIFVKTIYFYKSTIMVFEQMETQTLIGTIAFIITILCLLMCLPNKIRIKLSLIISVLISLLLWADNIYYIYSSSVISIEQLTNLQYTEQIIGTIPSLIRISQIVYFIDFIIIGILYLAKVL